MTLLPGSNRSGNPREAPFRPIGGKERARPASVRIRFHHHRVKIDEREEQGEQQRSGQETNGTQNGYAAQNGDQDEEWMYLRAALDEVRREQVVDEADRRRRPDQKTERCAGMSDEEKICDRGQ